MSWQKLKIKDVCDVYDGPHATPPKSDEGPIYLGISSIRPDGSIDYENSKRISYEDFPKWTKRVTPQKDDVVFSYEANLESYAIIPKGFEGCLGRRMAIMRPKRKKILPRFLYYYMHSPQWNRTIAERTVLGATVNRIPIATYPEFPIEVPDLDIQKSIVAVLGAYDDLIENNRKQISLLEEAAQRLYKEWFVDLRFPGHESTGISEGLPNGWTEAMLKDIADVVMGQSPKSEYYNDTGEGLPFHQGVSSFGLRFVRDETYTTSITRVGKAGSILFSVRAPVGRLNYTKNEIVLGRGLAAMNHRQGLQSYLYYMLKERFFKEDMIGNGSIFASISKGDLLAQKFVVPDRAIAERFNTLCRPIDKQIERCDDAIKAATEARDRLLPKLMSGEIEAL